jgi:hypothetical protein
MRQRRAIAVLIPTLTIAALVFWPSIRTSHLRRSFATVKSGDTRELVLKKMGSPWKDEKCGEYPGGVGVPVGCAEEFIYANPYAPALPEYWLIGFDTDHRVMDTVYSTSP